MVKCKKTFECQFEICLSLPIEIFIILFNTEDIQKCRTELGLDDLKFAVLISSPFKNVRFPMNSHKHGSLSKEFIMSHSMKDVMNGNILGFMSCLHWVAYCEKLHLK